MSEVVEALCEALEDALRTLRIEGCCDGDCFACKKACAAIAKARASLPHDGGE
jgi:hypothetical protein